MENSLFIGITWNIRQRARFKKNWRIFQKKRVKTHWSRGRNFDIGTDESRLRPRTLPGSSSLGCSHSGDWCLPSYLKGFYGQGTSIAGGKWRTCGWRSYYKFYDGSYWQNIFQSRTLVRGYLLFRLTLRLCKPFYKVAPLCCDGTRIRIAIPAGNFICSRCHFVADFVAVHVLSSSFIVTDKLTAFIALHTPLNLVFFSGEKKNATNSSFLWMRFTLNR